MASEIRMRYNICSAVFPIKSSTLKRILFEFSVMFRFFYNHIEISTYSLRNSIAWRQFIRTAC